MDIKIQIADSVYQDLLKNNHRVRGSIGLVTPTEGNFNAHRRRLYRAPEIRFIRLAHGKATVTNENVRLTLAIDRKESNVVPHRIIDSEAREAADFVFEQIIDDL